jgi:hypothetical protein
MRPGSDYLPEIRSVVILPVSNSSRNMPASIQFDVSWTPLKRTTRGDEKDSMTKLDDFTKLYAAQMRANYSRAQCSELRIASRDDTVMVMLIVHMMVMMMRVMMQSLTTPRHARILAENQGFDSHGYRV